MSTTHADTIRRALAVLLQECGESPSTEAGLAYSGAHRAVNQLEASAPQRSTYNHISLRHGDSRAFTNEVTELLNEGWEFSAPFVVAAGNDDRSDLWMAFLRREAQP